MQIDLDNPLCLDFIPRLELNGKTMLTSHGCSVVFNPCLPDGVINEAEAKWALEHYDLDTSYGWMIFRAAFPWTSKRRPEIKALSLTMEQQSCRVPGTTFQGTRSGDSFSFLHPVSGKRIPYIFSEVNIKHIFRNIFCIFSTSLFISSSCFVIFSAHFSPKCKFSFASFSTLFSSISPTTIMQQLSAV